MCLITAKPAGVPLTNRFYDIIKAGSWANSHGSGYMFKREKSTTIHLHKGFFPATMEGMIADIKNHNIGPNDFLVVHNRMATSGYTNVANCHPFPVTENDTLLQNDTVISEMPCIAHNGVFGDFSMLSKAHSDTYMFIKTFLAPNKVLEYRKAYQWLGEKIGGSRLTVLHPKFGICLVGDFQKDSGYFVSNKGYMYALNRKNNAINGSEIDDEHLAYCGI